MTQRNPTLIRPAYFTYGNTAAHHPTLFERITAPVDPIPRKLYLQPTPDFIEGEELDVVAPIPSRLEDLPALSPWVHSYVLSVVEIWAGKRPATQLMRWTHSSIYARLQRDVATIQAKVMRIHIAQPLEGISEVIVTLKCGDRIRAVIFRFEGADKKWKCTFLELI